MIVVSDASPVTSLAAVGQLDLLERLYGSVVIPEAVYRELTDPPDQPGSREVQSLSWISVQAAGDRGRVTSLLSTLDRGEAEAIALAIELHADLLLIDERLGRGVAESFGLKLVGTVGVLLAAKRQHYSGTIHLSAADGHGNFAALTLTHGNGFGACVTVEGLGLTLGHGMSRFDPDPGHPNAPGPGKRPLHNMVPTIVTRDGKAVLAVGGTGGRKIPNALLEVLTQRVVLGKPLAARKRTIS